MGAEAILKLLEKTDLETLRDELEKDLEDVTFISKEKESCKET